MVNAINSHPGARSLIVAAVNAGAATADVATPVINYSPIVFAGLGSSFNTATDLTDDTDLRSVLVITGNGGTFVDGQFFKITDNNNRTRTFEFDSDIPSVLNDNSAIKIPFTSELTPAEMAQLIRDAINQGSFNVHADLAGNTLRLDNDITVDLTAGVAGLSKSFQNQFDSGLVLSVSGGGDTFQEGQTFLLEEVSGTIRTFEFDSGFVLHIPSNGGFITDGKRSPSVMESAR